MRIKKDLDIYKVNIKVLLSEKNGEHRQIFYQKKSVVDSVAFKLLPLTAFIIAHCPKFVNSFF